MACHLNLADNPPLQALHDDTLAIKTLHRVGGDSNKVRSDMNIANIIVSELVVMACHLNLANNPPLQAVTLANKTLPRDGESISQVLLECRHY